MLQILPEGHCCWLWNLHNKRHLWRSTDESKRVCFFTSRDRKKVLRWSATRQIWEVSNERAKDFLTNVGPIPSTWDESLDNCCENCCITISVGCLVSVLLRVLCWETFFFECRVKQIKSAFYSMPKVSQFFVNFHWGFHLMWRKLFFDE